jgi:hypothetical protein
MKDFKNILSLIENELESRNEKATENYRLYCKVVEENERLKKEIQMLRNDLFELSKEYKWKVNQNKQGKENLKG